MDDALPRVTLTTTTSVDGRISLGRDRRLLDPDVRALWERIAAPGAFAGRQAELAADAVLEGSGSFVGPDAPAREWPSAVGDFPDGVPADEVPRRAPRWFVVADSRGRVDWHFTGDDAMRLHVLVCEATPRGYLARLRELGVGWSVVGRERVDLREALCRMRSLLGVRHVAADSGGTLNASLLRAGLVDVVDVVTQPGLVGGAGAPTMMDGPPLPPGAAPIRLTLLDVAVEGGAVRTRYAVQRPD